jgi:heptaprenyl diphosphate synthase
MSDGTDFHELVLGRSDTSFRSLFEAEWSAHLSSFPENFEGAAQLRIGSRFRPCLVAWGFLLAGGSFDLRARREVVHYGVYVELLHKATLLIDDLIDNDPARHGKPAFHVEFDDKEAMNRALFAGGSNS